VLIIVELLYETRSKERPRLPMRPCVAKLSRDEINCNSNTSARVRISLCFYSASGFSKKEGVRKEGGSG